MIKKQTASIRQAVNENENEGKEIIKEIIKYLSNDQIPINKNMKIELETLIKSIVLSIKHIQRTNSLTIEGFTKLNNQIEDNNNELNVLNNDTKLLDDQINNVWTNNCNLQYQIEFIEKLLDKEEN